MYTFKEIYTIHRNDEKNIFIWILAFKKLKLKLSNKTPENVICMWECGLQWMRENKYPYSLPRQIRSSWFETFFLCPSFPISSHLCQSSRNVTKHQCHTFHWYCVQLAYTVRPSYSIAIKVTLRYFLKSLALQNWNCWKKNLYIVCAVAAISAAAWAI